MKVIDLCIFYFFMCRRSVSIYVDLGIFYFLCAGEMMYLFFCELHRYKCRRSQHVRTLTLDHQNIGRAMHSYLLN
jgi:hypothetical protein